MKPNNTSTPLLDAVCRRGVLVATSVRYWRGCKKLSPEDLGLDIAHVSDRLIRLGHKRLIPRDALQAFALIGSRVQATVESSSFPFLGGIGRFVPNPRLGELTDRLEKLRDEFRDATLDFVAGYSPLRENAMAEWREAARHLNGSAEPLIATIDSFRRDLLQRSAEDYRNDSGAMASLTDGLNRLRENAVQFARSDARDVISRYGQMGGRRLAAVG